MTIDIEWGEVDGEKESETNWKKKNLRRYHMNLSDIY